MAPNPYESPEVDEQKQDTTQRSLFGAMAEGVSAGCTISTLVVLALIGLLYLFFRLGT